MAVNNRKGRFATEGIRFCRNNPDGTMPTPKRFLGFANTVDLSGVLSAGSAPLTIKIDSNPAETKTVSFASVINPAKVTVQEAVAALNAAGFSDTEFLIDEKTGRIKGSYGMGKPAVISCNFRIQMQTNSPSVIPANDYSIVYEGETYICRLAAPLPINTSSDAEMVFYAAVNGVKELPPYDYAMDVATVSPSIQNLAGQGLFQWASIFANNTVQGKDPIKADVVQATGRLAAALDFGNCIKHGGNGLEVISFFDNETISIGLAKTIKDSEEIDIESAKGTVTRMIIGAIVQGISPVVTLKQKDYYFLELIQGGKLDREKGTYDPPTSSETDHPTFHAEMFSALYSAGSSKLSDVSGYEKILFRSMMGLEGDVPADAKAWAQYAYNLKATECTDEFGNLLSAWQEQSMTLEEFDALKVKEV